tara:strand:+ start:2762 stop:3397 length:636 start_codon:yes stop_codon:yes gene_type:complete
MRNLLLIILFISNLGISQDIYPADTLISSQNSNFLEKATILPISAWQRLSYNSNLLSCQFYPSCSNYAAIAISQRGIFVGSAIAADRIVRCNPFALDYHYDLNGKFHYPDYRLIDPLHIIDSKNNLNKSPLIAAGLSTILPGSGRMYAGRFRDGLMGLWMIVISSTAAYSSFQENKNNKGNFFSIITLLFYTGEIYGAYRTAKYYQVSNNK